MIGEAKPLHPNEIDAMYLQMRNSGQYYIPRLLGTPLHIDEWKMIELEKWVDSRIAATKSANQ